MPRFRRHPSRKRAPKPTASWLVAGHTTARLISHGQITTHLIPVRPRDHHRRYHEGQRLSVKGFVGGPTECHIHVLTADRVPLEQIDFITARQLGYVRLDDFREAWIIEHDPKAGDEPLERWARHKDRDVWLLTFDVDRSVPPRLLAARSDELYVENAAQALPDEPEALSEADWKRHVEGNRDLTHDQWVALGRITKLQAKRRTPPKHIRKAA